MQPIEYICVRELAEHWCEIARRDGITVLSVDANYGVMIKIDNRPVEVTGFIYSDGRVSLNIELAFEPLRMRLARLLCASGAICNVFTQETPPILFCDEIYRCPSPIIQTALEELRSIGASVATLGYRSGETGERFAHGEIQSLLGDTITFECGAAYDTNDNLSCQYIAISNRVRFLRTPTQREFIASVNERFCRHGLIPYGGDHARSNESRY